MAEIRALFWDVGGVLLTNAWDHNQRQRAAVEFGIDLQDFEQRHESVVSAFETGKLSLSEYLQQTVFYLKRPFTPEQFEQAIYSQSQANPEALALARQLAASGRYLMSTINNESAELNAFRIRKFGLREIFDLFVSSCFVGLRKPDPAIYQLALSLTQRAPDECCFIDDRPENLAAPRQMGMHCIRMEGVERLRDELKQLGVEVS
ncbi:MAG TPA: HAD family phosphatase [Terriglobales bacterium]